MTARARRSPGTCCRSSSPRSRPGGWCSTRSPRSAIAEAVANPRDLDEDLVDAQETRRILDRLYGYEVSPVLWKKVMPRLSAGRVQSVATRLVVDRERERIAFRAASYWDLDAVLDAGEEAEPPLFPARLTRVGERRVAQGRDFDSRGQLISQGLRVSCCTWTRRRREALADVAADRRVRGRQRRVQALHPPPVRAVPDHDDAAGGRPQARLHRAAGDVGGPGPLRGRLHHLHANRLGAPCPTPRSPPPATRSGSCSAPTTCPTSRGSTPPRSRTPRRRTRRSGRPARPS